jgi:hypothetical protein
MARSDNTAWRQHRVDPRLNPLARKWESWSLPRGRGRELRRQWNKTQRHREREALARREEPEPTRTRHSVIYDYW